MLLEKCNVLKIVSFGCTVEMKIVKGTIRGNNFSTSPVTYLVVEDTLLIVCRTAGLLSSVLGFVSGNFFNPTGELLVSVLARAEITFDDDFFSVDTGFEEGAGAVRGRAVSEVPTFVFDAVAAVFAFALSDIEAEVDDVVFLGPVLDVFGFKSAFFPSGALVIFSTFVLATFSSTANFGSSNLRLLISVIRGTSPFVFASGIRDPFVLLTEIETIFLGYIQARICQQYTFNFCFVFIR